VGTDVTRIIRAEIALVQVRIGGALRVVKATGTGLVAAAVLGFTGFGVVIAGVVMIVATVVPLWLAAFAVGGGLLLVAGVVLTVEVRQLTRGVSEALSPVDSPAPGEESRHGQ
jgi:hypothetical protein